jgi:pimeloyl-ACP methyl ester carboxylesterase
MPEVTRIGSRTLRVHDVGADQEIVMPYATARDSTRLYYEEAGTGSPILFLHEFAADYASWEPQLRYFSRRHRCIAYSARGYTPSETPAADAFTYEHFRDDALAVLDHLGIEAAHLVGLSMGAYSSLQVGLISPERVLSLTLAGVGSGSEPARIEAFRESAQRNARDFETLGSPRSPRPTVNRRTGLPSGSRTRAGLRSSWRRWRVTTRRARRIRSVAFKADGRRSTLSRNTSGA